MKDYVVGMPLSVEISLVKQRLLAKDLKVGMYVVELDRPWIEAPFEHPFQLEGFKIITLEELQKVTNLCSYVYIDPARGDKPKFVEPKQTFRAFVEVVNELGRGKAPVEKYKDVVSVEEETSEASRILSDARVVYEKVIADLQSGSKVDAEGVKTVVGSLVGSVLRNAAAASWLIRLKHKDATTYSHSIAVAVLALTVGRYLGLPKSDLEVLGTAVLLQDIGKIQLPEPLLNKKDPLSDAERLVLKRHVETSVSMLKATKKFSRSVIEIVANHHERYDGSGYPRGVSGGIDLLSTIAGLVDVYEAMTSARPYRGARTSFEALMELYNERDKAFPGAIVEQFIQCVGIFPVGSFVQLNTGEIGVVVHRNRLQQLSPRIMILIGRSGRKRSRPKSIDLASQESFAKKSLRVITKMVDPRAYQLDPAEFFA